MYKYKCVIFDCDGVLVNSEPIANSALVEMAKYIFDFALTGNKFYNGKLLQVSSSTP